MTAALPQGESRGRRPESSCRDDGGFMGVSLARGDDGDLLSGFDCFVFCFCCGGVYLVRGNKMTCVGAWGHVEERAGGNGGLDGPRQAGAGLPTGAAVVSSGPPVPQGPCAVPTGPGQQAHSPGFSLSWRTNERTMLRLRDPSFAKTKTTTPPRERVGAVPSPRPPLRYPRPWHIWPREWRAGWGAAGLGIASGVAALSPIPPSDFRVFSSRRGTQPHTHPTVAAGSRGAHQAMRPGRPGSRAESGPHSWPALLLLSSAPFPSSFCMFEKKQGH